MSTTVKLAALRTRTMRQQLQQLDDAIRQENREKFSLIELQQQDQLELLSKLQELSSQECGRVAGGTNPGASQGQEIASLKWRSEN